MGIRPSLIPVLINDFQNREMKVKWKGIFSKVRPMPGGGPQGATFGNLEYSAQSNDNADMVDIEDRFKFFDDLTALEIINLLCTQITTYDLQSHVPSDIPIHNGFIEKENIKSQQNLSLINQCTRKKKMKPNMEKTKNIIFNLNKNFKFTIRLREGFN